MGVIKRQTLYGSLYSYIGVVIGFVTTGILFPNYFTSEEVGLVNMLIAYSTIFAQFASLGFNNATFRLFPYFRNADKKHKGFLFLAIFAAIIGFLLSVGIIIILKPYLTSYHGTMSSLMVSYYIYIVPIVLFVLLFNLFDTYYTVLYNSVIGTFLKELLLRFLILLAFLGFFYQLFNFHGFVIGFTLSYFLPFLIIFLFLLRAGQINFRPRFEFLDKNMVRTLSAVSLFGLISYSTDIIVFNIDRIMIDRLMGLSDAGIYSTAFLFGAIVMVPSRSLFKISTTIIADAWKNNDLKTLREIYSKSCLNQFFIGVLIFLLILVNLENIMHILPKDYGEGKYVIVLISLAMLFNMVVGINGVLIMTSKEYRMNTYLLFLLAILIFVSNLIFIPQYGILGSAIATMISKLIINVLRAIYVNWKFGMQPYNYKFGLILLIFGISYVVHILLPVNDNFILDIIVRSLIILALFGIASFYLKVSEELNGIVLYIFNLVKKPRKS